MKISILTLDSMIEDLQEIIKKTDSNVIALKAEKVGRKITEIRNSIEVTIKA